MPLNIRNEEVNRLAEQLASRIQTNKTEAVKRALENELKRQDQQVPLSVRLQPLLDRVAKWPSTGLEADKAFYDDLYE